MDRPDAASADSGDPATVGAGSRARAVVVAGHRSDLPTIEAHLADRDPAVRVAALGALGRAGVLTAHHLSAAAADPHPDVRARASELAAATDLVPAEGSPGREAVLDQLEGALVGLLADADDRVVEVAAFACGELPMDGDRSASGRISALAAVATGHHDSLCRESAVAALGALGHPDGLAAVMQGCGDRANVRRRAVLALAAFEGEQVTAMLGTLTADRDLQVSQAATDLLAIETGEDT